MKHPAYDSPFELVVSDITTQAAKNIDEMCWQAVQRAAINIDKEKLLIALKQDSERYRKAYAKGYETGYEKRDEEIIRCEDCVQWIPGTIDGNDNFNPPRCKRNHGGWSANDFCSNPERREKEDGEN